MLKLSVSTVEKSNLDGSDLRNSTTIVFGDGTQGVDVNLEHPVGEGPSPQLMCSALVLLAGCIRRFEWK